MNTDGSRFGVTLRVAIHVPPAARGCGDQLGAPVYRDRGKRSDERGFVRIALELR